MQSIFYFLFLMDNLMQSMFVNKKGENWILHWTFFFLEIL